jgi:hypothetical protein
VLQFSKAHVAKNKGLRTLSRTQRRALAKSCSLRKMKQKQDQVEMHKKSGSTSIFGMSTLSDTEKVPTES